MTYLKNHFAILWNTKESVLKNSQSSKLLLGSQSRKEIKIMKSDNGGEYLSKEF
jgi:hypothetical protein